MSCFKSRTNGRKHRPLQPRRWLALGVHRSLHVHGRDRVVVVELDSSSRRPDNFHRLAELLREHRGFGHVVRLRLAAEAAAEQRHVAGDIFFRDPEFLSRRFPAPPADSASEPSCDLAVLELRHRDRRFHRSVRQMRDVVVGFDDLAALGEFGVDVAEFRDHLARLARGLLQLLLVFIGVVDAFGPWSQSDLQLLAALERSPGVVGDHRHAAQWLERCGGV